MNFFKTKVPIFGPTFHTRFMTFSKSITMKVCAFSDVDLFLVCAINCLGFNGPFYYSGPTGPDLVGLTLCHPQERIHMANDFIHRLLYCNFSKKIIYWITRLLDIRSFYGRISVVKEAREINGELINKCVFKN